MIRLCSLQTFTVCCCHSRLTAVPNPGETHCPSYLSNRPHIFYSTKNALHIFLSLSNLSGKVYVCSNCLCSTWDWGYFWFDWLTLRLHSRSTDPRSSDQRYTLGKRQTLVLLLDSEPEPARMGGVCWHYVQVDRPILAILREPNEMYGKWKKNNPTEKTWIGWRH